MQRNISLIGPIEPTGLSWLINCLLELNIECSIDGNTWNRSGTDSRIKSSKLHLRRWLPALQDESRIFEFREGIKVSWSHDWLNKKHQNQKSILFTREPKTALYSGYKRLGSTEMSFSDYLIEIDPQWLLNRKQLWNLFHATWSNHPDIKVFFFEDYKEDAFSTLCNVLQWLSISDIPDYEIARAVESSTWEKAKLSEEAYLKDMGLDSPQMIRSGSTMVENKDQELEAYRLIDEECGPLHNLIREGNRTDFYIRTSPLSFHVIEFLRKKSNLTPFVFTSEEITFRLTGIYEINQKTIELATQNQTRDHLMASIQRKVFQNFASDIKLLIQVNFGEEKFSRTRFCFHSFRTLTKIFGRYIRGLFKPNPER